MQRLVYGEVVLPGEPLGAHPALVLEPLLRPVLALVPPQRVAPLEGLPAVGAHVVPLLPVRVHVRGEVLLEAGRVVALVALEQDVAGALCLLLAALGGLGRGRGGGLWLGVGGRGKLPQEVVAAFEVFLWWLLLLLLLLLLRCEICQKVWVELQLCEGLVRVVRVECVRIVGGIGRRGGSSGGGGGSGVGVASGGVRLLLHCGFASVDACRGGDQSAACGKQIGGGGGRSGLGGPVHAGVGRHPLHLGMVVLLLLLQQQLLLLLLLLLSLLVVHEDLVQQGQVSQDGEVAADAGGGEALDGGVADDVLLLLLLLTAVDRRRGRRQRRGDGRCLHGGVPKETGK